MRIMVIEYNTSCLEKEIWVCEILVTNSSVLHALLKAASLDIERRNHVRCFMMKHTGSHASHAGKYPAGIHSSR